ncbi:MAG: hypothetical protein WC325_13340 [Candidatus Bathyarchaeia archaeon]
MTVASVVNQPQRTPLRGTLTPYVEASKTAPLHRDDLSVSPLELQQAVNRAEKDNPTFWQAEMIEIAMIPSVKRSIEQMSDRKLNIERVKTKYGNGYVLEGSNRIDDEYYSTNPAKVWDSIRRNYIGAQDLEFLRMTTQGNDYAKTQLRHFKIEDKIPMKTGKKCRVCGEHKQGHDDGSHYYQ